MDNSLLSAIQRMGNNFLVAAFVPAMGFIVITSITFSDLLPPELRFLGDNEINIIQSALNLLLFTTVLGFTLFSLSTYIYKSFEGYTFILGIKSPLRKSFLRRQIRRFQKNEFNRLLTEKQIARIEQKINKELEQQNYLSESKRSRRLERYKKEINSLYDRQYAIASDRSESFPPDQDLILPTRFGNILRAAEMYAGRRYGIDSVPLWGRVAHVIPPDGMEKIDQANNQCLFLLNGSLLAAVYGVACLLVSIIGGFSVWKKLDIIFLAPVSDNMFLLYLFLGIMSGVIAWFFYTASLLNVSQYGSMIRTAYDLYRFNLIDALRLRLPTTLREEKQLWRRIGHFMVGNDQWERIAQQETLEKHPESPDAGFEYHHPKDKKVK